MANTLEELKLELVIVDGNPRTKFDKKGESFKSFVANVKRHGIITPITVELTDDGIYKLVAGQRRLAAAKEAGLHTIPASVRASNGSSAAMAVSENIHREALTPMQEAKAFSKAKETMSLDEIAAAYSVSKDFISGRIKLLRLPEALQNGIDEGTVLMGAAKILSDISEHSPELALAIAELMDDEDSYNPVTLAQLIKNTGHVITQAARGNDKVVAFNVANRSLGADDLAGLPERRSAELMQIFDKCERWGSDLLLTEDDIAAAEAFGCLLTVVDSFDRDSHFVTNADFLYDRLKPNLVNLAAKTQDKRGAEYAQGKVPPTAEQTADAQSKEEAKRKKERDEAKKARLGALTRNLELGEALAVKAKKVKPDKDVMALLGDLIVNAYGTDLFLRGFRYSESEFKHVTPAKREGSLPKVERIDTREEAKDTVERMWAKCKTAEEMAGFLVRLVTAAAYADQRETSNADRKGQPIPWLGGEVNGISRPYRRSRGGSALTRIATKLLPSSVKTAAKQRAR